MSRLTKTALSLFCGFFYLFLYSSAALGDPSSNNKDLKHIYKDNPYTFFCNAPFDEHYKIKFKPCENCLEELIPIVWMPIVSKYQLAANRPCFSAPMCTDSQGKSFNGIRCCAKQDELYKKMIQDLHNLVPEVSFLLQQRGKLEFGELPSQESLVKQCYFRIDKKLNILEPSPHVRGMIARAYLYMAETYPITLTMEQRNLFLKWHHEYPVTEWEKVRNEKIKALQGNSNRFVEDK